MKPLHRNSQRGKRSQWKGARKITKRENAKTREGVTLTHRTLLFPSQTPSRMSVQKIKNNNAFHILNEIRQSLAF